MSEKAKEELKRRAQGCGKHSQSISNSEEHSNTEDEDEKLPHSQAFKKLQPFLHLSKHVEGPNISCIDFSTPAKKRSMIDDGSVEMCKSAAAPVSSFSIHTKANARWAWWPVQTIG